MELYTTDIVIIITGILGSLITYIINNNFKQGGVRASAMPSLVVGLFFYLFPEVLSPYLTHQIPLVFIGASFVGMVSNQLLHQHIFVGLAGLIFAITYINTGTFFKGFGGALGTTACIAILTATGLANLLKHKGIKRKKNVENN
ncbi:hypothetical protein [Zunongwangia sp.]|uniref:hypothetical protein n=1 Tax=Zunongwangia sp. TaxID=1965325 RepID=UPI003AA9A86C